MTNASISLDLDSTALTENSDVSSQKISAANWEDCKLDLNGQDMGDSDMQVVVQYAFQNTTKVSASVL